MLDHPTMTKWPATCQLCCEDARSSHHSCAPWQKYAYHGNWVRLTLHPATLHSTFTPPNYALLQRHPSSRSLDVHQEILSTKNTRTHHRIPDQRIPKLN